MSKEDDIMHMIKLLAGAAQAGANGVVAQAAYNLMKASEAVTLARKLKKDDEFQQAAMDQLLSARQTLFLALEIPDAMAEAKQDLIKTGQCEYRPEE